MGEAAKDGGGRVVSDTAPRDSGARKLAPQSPRVFISYSHDSEAHRKRVLALSERLRQDGIDADLDQYVNGTPDQGWPRWMEDGLDWADRVLVVCTETYYRRFRGHEDPGKGKGVDWEGAIVTNELYTERSQTKKFVPIIYAAEDERFVPASLAGHTRYLLTSEDAYRQLYDALLGQSGVEPGEIGSPERKGRRRVEPATFDSQCPTELSVNSTRSSRPSFIVAGLFLVVVVVAGLLLVAYPTAEQSRIRDKPEAEYRQAEGVRNGAVARQTVAHPAPTASSVDHPGGTTTEIPVAPVDSGRPARPCPTSLALKAEQLEHHRATVSVEPFDARMTYELTLTGPDGRKTPSPLRDRHDSVRLGDAATRGTFTLSARATGGGCESLQSNSEKISVEPPEVQDDSGGGRSGQKEKERSE